MNAKRRILDIGFATFRQVAKRIPKKHGLVLFGARRGLWYMDNSKQVYEWVLENRPDLHPVWMTRNKKVAKDLKERGLPVCHTSSPRAFYLLMRAPLAVTSTQLYDITSIPECPPDNLRIVFLGHGKSVKASSLAKKRSRSQWSTSLFQRKAQLIDVGISTSPYISKLAAKSNGLGEDRFHVTGYPVNDLLVHPPARLKTRFEEYLDGLRPSATVLYAPTWRPSWQEGMDPTRFFPFPDFNRKTLIRFLEENRVLLILRPHELDLLKYGKFHEFIAQLEASTPWIRISTPHDYENVNDLLPFVDCLISDYSSIYHDYLLLDRPMAFIPYDHESFGKHIGFMYDYFNRLPGPAVATQGKFLEVLSNILDGKDTHQEKRRSLRDLIHTHTDGNATQRVVSLLDERLNGNGTARNKAVVRVARRNRGTAHPVKDPDENRGADERQRSTSS